MIGEMNVTGVDIGVLQSDHVYGELDEYYHETMQRYPDRFIALAQVWEPGANEPEVLARLEHSVKVLGCQAVYFSVEPFSILGKAERSVSAKKRRLQRPIQTPALNHRDRAWP